MYRLIVWLAVFLAAGSGALADQTGESGATKPLRNAVWAFGGWFTTGEMYSSAIPLMGGFEGTVILGGAYERRFYESPRGFQLSGELGAAARLGPLSSAEGWGAIGIGYRGFKLGSAIIAPAFFVGLSAVTGASAMEPVRIRQWSPGGVGDPRLLVYLGPEVAFRHASIPDFEFVYRLHHRSGAWATLGNMKGGNNAQVFGIRRRF
jgi:hypothetical protein